MDALMPLASLPATIGRRNRMWRKMIADMIRTDPDWHGGDYTTQPHGLALAAEMLLFMGGNPARRYTEAPTGAAADALMAKSVASAMKSMDANDVLYALESSRDYDPGPKLEAIKAPL